MPKQAFCIAVFYIFFVQNMILFLVFDAHSLDWTEGMNYWNNFYALKEISLTFGTAFCYRSKYDAGIELTQLHRLIQSEQQVVS